MVRGIVELSGVVFDDLALNVVAIEKPKKKLNDGGGYAGFSDLITRFLMVSLNPPVRSSITMMLSGWNVTGSGKFVFGSVVMDLGYSFDI
ncbi:hypothetical protein L1987_65278 [Smallanthus sonchifolius]|uniref:Uncharacterized protein n=1 Tax=Smallanthus sonchifolius TaxID=185202 RepID=A0ACB9BU41_9ASTR|nr:hypothetical protein L1987_65278 [Smallanthus sonchifolius]